MNRATQQKKAKNPRVSILSAIFNHPFFDGLKRAWFTAILSAIITLALVLPGLASGQIREAIIDYARDLERLWATFYWPGVFVVIISVAFFTIGLAYWTAKLLLPDEGRGTIKIESLPGSQQLLISLIYALPWLGISYLFFSVGEELGLDLAGTLASPYGAIAGFCFILFISLILIWHHPMLDGARAAVYRADSLQWLFASFATLVFGALAFIFTVSPYAMDNLNSVAVARLFGPVALLAVLLGVFAALGSWLLLLGRRFKAPIFPLVLITPFVIGGIGLNDNHPVRSIARDEPVNQQSFENTVINWCAARDEIESETENESENRPYILVSTEGGGIRASYFTAVILSRIADKCPAVANRIFSISSVSGGSIGAAVYAAAIHAEPLDARDQRCDFSDPNPGPYEQRMNMVFRMDHLSPVLARMLFPDALQRFLPFPIDTLDRQLGLEHSFLRSFTDAFESNALDAKISDLKIAPDGPPRPIMFFNATSVESGAPVVGSQIYLFGDDSFRIRSFQAEHPSKDFSLISLAGTSARFPYISPAGYIEKGDSKERFVDGGYFDNSGAEVSLLIYNSLRSVMATSETVTPAPIILLHIGNQPECDYGRATSEKPCGQRPSEEGLHELLSPLRAVLRTRSSRIDFTLFELKRMATPVQDNNIDTQFLKFQLFRNGIPVPLGWYLSNRAADEMTRQLEQDSDDGCDDVNNPENACVFRKLKDEIEG